MITKYNRILFLCFSFRLSLMPRAGVKINSWKTSCHAVFFNGWISVTCSTERCCASYFPKMAKCELIELQDLTPDDRIELAPPTGLPPISGHTLERWGTEKAVRMMGKRVRLEDPDWLTGTPGREHDFQPSSQTQLSWCDLCGEFIWGLYKQSLCCTRESQLCVLTHKLLLWPITAFPHGWRMSYTV